MGNLILVNDESKRWIKNYYSKLKISSNQKEIKGDIDVIASYNFDTNQFQNLSNGQEHLIGGTILSGKISLAISTLINRPWSILPGVYIYNKDIPSILDRHFYEHQDKSGCLCSPIIENEYLIDGFILDRFVEGLVIPFLYGQLHYNIYKKWPWNDYAHGNTGILESYYIESQSRNVNVCLNTLRMNQQGLKMIVRCLRLRKAVGGHLPCFCGSNLPIRNCHRNAWLGINQLKDDIRRID
jgi:hypothetical protein